jgi:hypothetical protein
VNKFKIQFLNCFPDGQSDELKPTQDGLGWVCGEDIDVTRTEEPEVLEKSTLEDEIGEG